MPEIFTTNAQSYENPERCIMGTTTGQKDSPANGESGQNAASKILRYPLPEWYSMDVVYRGLAQTLLVIDFWPEDESVEDFIAAAMEGRHEEDEPDS
jgi:hypothetical protein